MAAFVKSCLASALVLAVAEAKLRILTPESLAKQFTDGQIQASYANFGFIPYGQKIMGQIHYDPDNSDACNAYDTEDKTELERSGDLTPFYVSQRGGCSFVQKVRNMENIGVAVGIVVDDWAENIEEVLMSDDGTGGGIRIPSMLIGKGDGNKLLQWWQLATPEERQELVLMAEFVMPYESGNKVEWDFWMTSSSDRALDFLEDFEQMNSSFGSDIVFTPHYVFWECPGCDAIFLENDCFGGGKYCALEPSNGAIKGQEIILEDLRQKCLFNNMSKAGTPEKWWDYIERVHSTCYSVINEDCSTRAHEHLDLDFEETQKCVNDSFSHKSGWERDLVSNSIIDKEISYWTEFGTNIYPSIVINKRNYRGQIDSLSVFNAICAGFEEPPYQCLKTLHREPQNSFAEALGLSASDGVTFTEVIALVFGLVLLNVMVVYCCRRNARREMQSEMQMQIESQVSQYFALTNQKKTNQV